MPGASPKRSITLLVRDFSDQTRADDLVVRPDSRAAELARTYTLTSGTRTRLDTLLREIDQLFAKNQDIGRIIYGSLGSAYHNSCGSPR